jgi:hypothetical protein
VKNKAVKFFVTGVLLLFLVLTLVKKRMTTAAEVESLKVGSDVAKAQLTKNSIDNPGNIASKVNSDLDLRQSAQSAAPASANSNMKPSVRASFIRLTERALNELPRQKQFETLKEKDVHAAPTLLLIKGALLADVAQAVSDNPALSKDAEKFYQKCSLNAEIVLTIRARCLSHFTRLSKESNRHVNYEEYPQEVVRLSSLIP